MPSSAARSGGATQPEGDGRRAAASAPSAPGCPVRPRIAGPRRAGEGSSAPEDVGSTASVGMALACPDTGGIQFFITLSEQPHLDGGYTAFGEVVSGDEVLDLIVPGDRIESLR